MTRAHFPLYAIAALSLVGLAACRPSAPSALKPTPRASIQEIMQSQVDAPADKIWGATSTIVDANGSKTFAPSTDEEWEALREAAMTLLEAPNLLVMEGRPLLKAGAKVESQGEGWIADTAYIQSRLDNERPLFAERAAGLQTVATEVLTAIDKRDVAALEISSGKMLEACHACHSHFWFAPPKAR